MSREHHRERKLISTSRARWLTRLGFRYSLSRDAYVLRIVGNRFGPVYQIAPTPRPKAPESESQGASQNTTH